jgi:hypothetical protein
VTARRQFGAAIAACVAGAGLVLLALRQGWARVDYTAPRPLPSGSIPVSGQDLLPAAGALGLAALACLAAIIATRGPARRVAGVVMAGLGAWIAVLASAPVHAASVMAAASGQAAAAGFAGSLPGGNSAISGGIPSGGGLPAIGQASRVVLASAPWRPAALIGAAAVIAAGLAAAWRGPRWAVMPARFGRPAPPPEPAGGASAPAPGAVPAAGVGPAAGAVPATQAAVPAAGAGQPGEPGPAGPARAEPGRRAPHPDGSAAELWEALDRGVDLTDAPEGGAPPAVAPARTEKP